ncbi:hypothetical protein EW145_g6284 [Phellinidium pouzarii]|uniref:Uncharacterized protein n=1 Tax=Phellinidium pouzarii TaxID=167371 RepID=A0A4S4KY88_9AGAM|nr:hypothetical protein EW145_g6284 [Phellinidium pouzarii]
MRPDRLVLAKEIYQPAAEEPNTADNKELPLSKTTGNTSIVIRGHVAAGGKGNVKAISTAHPYNANGLRKRAGVRKQVTSASVQMKGRGQAKDLFRVSDRGNPAEDVRPGPSRRSYRRVQAPSPSPETAVIETTRVLRSRKPVTTEGTVPYLREKVREIANESMRTTQTARHRGEKRRTGCEDEGDASEVSRKRGRAASPAKVVAPTALRTRACLAARATAATVTRHEAQTTRSEPLATAATSPFVTVRVARNRSAVNPPTELADVIQATQTPVSPVTRAASHQRACPHRFEAMHVRGRALRR